MDTTEQKNCEIPFPNNMGMVRYWLAISVIFSHFSYLTGIKVPFIMSSYSAVGGFFALSGFLIYRSYLKKPDLASFVKSRAIRILPAYWITVLIFSILLFFTTDLSFSQYFLSSGFWKYLAANITFLNFLEPSLPGVFSNIANGAVNGSLWTMKVEWTLYLSVPAVAYSISRLKVRPPVMFTAIYLASSAYRILFHHLHELSGDEIYSILGRQFFGQLSYFYAGAMIHYYLTGFLQYKWSILIVAITLTACADWIPYYSFWLHPLVIGTLVIWFSIVGKWGIQESKRNNISYNIYLIHYPVINLLVFYNTTAYVTPPMALLLCIAVTFILSIVINRAETRIQAKLRSA